MFYRIFLDALFSSSACSSKEEVYLFLIVRLSSGDSNLCSTLLCRWSCRRLTLLSSQVCRIWQIIRSTCSLIPVPSPLLCAGYQYPVILSPTAAVISLSPILFHTLHLLNPILFIQSGINGRLLKHNRNLPTLTTKTTIRTARTLASHTPRDKPTSFLTKVLTLHQSFLAIRDLQF